MTHATALQNHRLMLGGRSFLPLMLGGMGTNISTAELALAVERLGGIAHLSDAMLMDLSDRLFGTRFTAEKAKRTASERDNMDKSAVTFNLDNVKEAARRYVSDVMSRATGHGLVLINCMEKLTMNAGLETLRARLTAALDGGIDGITLSAGLHLSSMKLMADHPRFKDALIGIIVSSSRALNLFLKKSASTGRLPDYVVVEGPLAGGHLGFGMDWANYSLADIVKDVKAFLAKSSLNIPVIAAGGIFTGGEAAEMMSDTGCDGIQAATRFAVAQESGLPYAVKQAYFNAKPEDIVVNHLSPTGYPMRMLRQSPAITGDIRPNCEAYGKTSRRSGAFVGKPLPTAHLHLKCRPKKSAASAPICATTKYGRAAPVPRAFMKHRSDKLTANGFCQLQPTFFTTTCSRQATKFCFRKRRENTLPRAVFQK